MHAARAHARFPAPAIYTRMRDGSGGYWSVVAIIYLRAHALLPVPKIHLSLIYFSIILHLIRKIYLHKTATMEQQDDCLGLDLSICRVTSTVTEKRRETRTKHYTLYSSKQAYVGTSTKIIVLTSKQSREELLYMK